MESGLLIPFIQELVTKLSLLPQQWSHSSQESSAKLQSIAETGNPSVVYQLGSMFQKLASFIILLVANVVLWALVVLPIT